MAVRSWLASMRTAAYDWLDAPDIPREDVGELCVTNLISAVLSLPEHAMPSAYRYLHEALDVISARSPDLPLVLTDGLQAGWSFVCLDGTLVPATRSSQRSENGVDQIGRAHV